MSATGCNQIFKQLKIKEEEIKKVKDKIDTEKKNLESIITRIGEEVPPKRWYRETGKIINLRIVRILEICFIQLLILGKILLHFIALETTIIV